MAGRYGGEPWRVPPRSARLRPRGPLLVVRHTPVQYSLRPAHVADRLRTRVTQSVAEPFGHHEPPLQHTLDHPGDPGICGPASVTWLVMARVTTFIGGIRGLLIQACHPEVVAGVHDHSRYQQDPLGRLSRTAHYVTTTAYGAMPEVDRAVAFVRGRHAPVMGASHRGRVYAADDPALAAWVHNALTDSFLTTHQAYSRHSLSQAGADRFVAEQTQVGRLLDADPLPTTAAGLAAWVADHPAVAPSPGMHAAVQFLRSPPLSRAQRAGYAVLFEAAVATLPPRLRDVLGLRQVAGGHAAGVVADRFLGLMMGDSPAWKVALTRVGADTSVGRFRRSLPTAATSAATDPARAPRAPAD